MMFEEVVDQAVAMLQRRGRVAYRMLKRQFELDDDVFEDLKATLLYDHPENVNDDGQGLTWSDAASVLRKSASSLFQPIQDETPSEADASRAEVSSSVMPGGDAERRQLTVMFCDLVDSTALSGQLDPEDLRDVIRAYQAVCAEVIQRFDGHVAQLLGDGLLVYFGYPQAHEDDAQRAIHAGLGMLDAMGTLNQRLECDEGVRLAIRVGIHTGLVVVGEMGGEGRQELLALGETPNVAARVQGLTEPDTVVISSATHELAQGYFEHETLGQHLLRGVAEPMMVYRVLRASGVQSRLDIVSTRGLTPLVGRESEMALLLDCWGRVQEGKGQVVLLSGEAGIGKSRLARALCETLVDQPHFVLEGQCSPFHRHTALYPLIHLLQKHLQFNEHMTSVDKLSRLENLVNQCRLDVTQSMPLLASLLNLPLEEPVLTPELSPQQQRQRTLEILLNIVIARSQEKPTLFFIEDGHWLDPSTLEWLDLLVDQGPTTSILTLVTCRPEFESPWRGREHVTFLTLSQLSQAQITQMVEAIAGEQRVPIESVDQIVITTDGVPLFVEEITRLLIESNPTAEFNAETGSPVHLSAIQVPATLHDLLMARLDSVGEAKLTAQIGATIGREFSVELLQAISPLDEERLYKDLEKLMSLDLLYQRGSGLHMSYQFKHALIQEAAYESQLRRTRQDRHRNIAQALEASFHQHHEGDLELMAHHYTKADETVKAVIYWLRAGERAAQRSAHREAVVHLYQGIELLQRLPETEDRLQQELNLYVALGSSLYTVKGFADPEVEHAHLRARTLCQQLGDTEHLYQVLRGLVLFYVNQGTLTAAEALANELLELAEQQDDLGARMLGHYSLVIVLVFQGKLREALQHGERVIAMHDLQAHRDLIYTYGIDIGVATRSFISLALWLRGYPEQALAHGQTAVQFAQQLAHPFSRVTAQTWLVWLYYFRREPDVAYETAIEGHALASEWGFSLYGAFNRMWQGWAVTVQGHLTDGTELMQEAMHATLAMGTDFFRPYHLALIAEAAQEGDTPYGGAVSLSEALRLVGVMDGYWWEAELHRVQGELLLRQPGDHTSPASMRFAYALDIARAQNAKSLELRAAMSLSRLWQAQGKRQEAYDLLAPVYSWFTEGFDTADLIDAKALLAELSDKT